MLNKKELDFLQSQIKNTISSIERTHFQIIKEEEYDGEYEEEYPGWTRSWIGSRLQDLYYLIIAFLEAKGSNQLLIAFIASNNDIGNASANKRLLKTIQTYPESDVELEIIVNFKRFLEPFMFFSELGFVEDEKKKLMGILANTGFILKNANAKIKNETDIYNQVKWILNLYYPSTRRNAKSTFIHQFKTYNADILIPELGVAIEYKYLRSLSDNIDNFLDQVKIDATNYTGDSLYNTFIAVFFIEDISIATPETIEIAWTSKKFPKEWELIITGHAINGIVKGDDTMATTT